MKQNNTSAEPLLVARHITRVFGAAKALSDASITLRRNEVCGLLGANGAGKSTLSRIITGHLSPSSGVMSFRGSPFQVTSTRNALRYGIAMVAQETSLAPDMSVLENIFMPIYALPGRLSFPQLRQNALAILSELGHDHVLQLDVEVRRLSSAQRQLVEIAKALALNADLVIFDEPTASLSPTEVDHLFNVIARLKKNGKALAFVSHRLEEVFAITDRVTILREGKTVAEDLATNDLTQTDIIRHMVGRDIGNMYRAQSINNADDNRPVTLEVENLSAPPAARNISFSVRKGEILGLGGLVGAGRSEAVEAIFGIRHRTGGRIKVNGNELNIHSPIAAVRAGIGMVAEDRRAQNIVQDLTVEENLFLAQMGKHRGFGRGFSLQRDKANELISRIGIPADRMKANLLHFSGGMQQKVIIARWLLIEPKVLILDEPTKGVDIGTRQAIYQLLQEVADQGIAVVVISSDFEELLGISERIVIVSDGYTVADIPSSQLNVESLTLLAAPRSSAERNGRLLRELVATYGGTAFWGLVDDTKFICLSVVDDSSHIGIGFAAGNVYTNNATMISTALANREARLTVEADGRHTIMTRLLSPRNHDLGWIGLSLPPNVSVPDPETLVSQVAAMFETPKVNEAYL